MRRPVGGCCCTAATTHRCREACSRASAGRERPWRVLLPRGRELRRLPRLTALSAGGTALGKYALEVAPAAIRGGSGGNRPNAGRSASGPFHSRRRIGRNSSGPPFVPLTGDNFRHVSVGWGTFSFGHAFLALFSVPARGAERDAKRPRHSRLESYPMSREGQAVGSASW